MAKEKMMQEIKNMRHLKEIENKLKYLKAALNQMMSQYAEKRSDVHEYLEGILTEADLNTMKKIPEHRFIAFSFGGTNFLYDTLTTLVEYQTPEGKWHVIDDIRYYDDSSAEE